jgi:hypothetical protein
VTKIFKNLYQYNQQHTQTPTHSPKTPPLSSSQEGEIHDRKGKHDNGRSAHPLASTKMTDELRQSAVTNAAKRTPIAQSIVLVGESFDTFEVLRKSCYDFWQPQDQFEADLVEDMVAARWRLTRIRTAETQIAARCVAACNEDGQPRPNSREDVLIRIFSASQSRYNRQLRQTITSLRDAQNHRRDREAEIARAEAKLARATAKGEKS